MRRGDSIAALSSGSLPSGVAIVRISGPACREVLTRLCGGVPAPRQMALRTVWSLGGAALDQGLVVFFPGHHSFTGEDCAELHLHGSRAVVQAVLRELSHLGVRLAEPGEFTRQAFENGRLDLTEVEGISDLLAAETEGQRALALARMAGGLSRLVGEWRLSLTALRAEIEALLDFSDEDDVANDLAPDWFAQVDRLLSDLHKALSGFSSGRMIRDGFRVALAGPPNAGKSSLLNRLTQSEVAIVSPEAGTTRDVREVHLDLAGRLVILVDMAGLRAASSLAEQEGVRRAQLEIASADLVLWLVAPDAAAPVPLLAEGKPAWVVGSKSDLGGGVKEARFHVSCVSGDGVEALLSALCAQVTHQVPSGEILISRERDRAALAEAAEVLELARDASLPLEVLAEHLRRASQSLARLTGAIGSEDVLDALFARFCIGK